MEYQNDDIAALLREHPKLRKPSCVKGPRLVFRPALPNDAEFILSLRLDKSKNQHLSPVPPDVERQRLWLENMPTSEVYFVVEHQRQPVGTVRLYDQQGTSFCWGSWILSNDAPQSSAIESTLMVYEFGMALGFSAAHFDVRKGNEKVWQYHERIGAQRTGERAGEYLYCMTRKAMLSMLERYRSRLATEIEIIW